MGVTTIARRDDFQKWIPKMELWGLDQELDTREFPACDQHTSDLNPRKVTQVPARGPKPTIRYKTSNSSLDRKAGPWKCILNSLLE